MKLKSSRYAVKENVQRCHLKSRKISPLEVKGNVDYEVGRDLQDAQHSGKTGKSQGIWLTGKGQ